MNEKTGHPDMSNVGAMRIQFVDFHWERPPKVSLVFDVTLRNEQTGPRWFLLPDQLDLSPQLSIGPIEAVEVYKLEQGTGRVIVGHFRGSGGFYAVFLCGNAEATLRRFPIPMWSSPPEFVVIEAVITNRLMIAGEPAELWFEMDPVSDTLADVQAGVLAEQKRVIAGKSASGPDELPVALAEDERIRINIPLPEAVS
jgi:hypothetical protein